MSSRLLFAPCRQSALTIEASERQNVRTTKNFRKSRVARVQKRWIGATSMPETAAERREIDMVKKALGTIVAVVLAAAAWTCAQAQGYPEKAIKIVVPYAPGGSTDPVSYTHL